MQNITINFPRKLTFGNGSSDEFIKDYTSLGLQRLLIVTAEPIRKLVDPVISELKSRGIEVTVYDNVNAEPEIEDLEEVLRFAKKNKIDSVAGIGGGSVLDLAKLVAAMLNSEQSIHQAFGIGNLKSRVIYLACLPTTSGTGSEVSPNAILLDKSDNLKKGVVSPYLVPDSAYVNPLLTISVPPPITAATGLDALTHCLEEYTNIFAHPVIDLYAKEGINLISRYLKRAYDDGNDIEARERVALGSLYGGIGLGPVNTAAVHALSYPLGGEFHIPHGLSNAVLLPYVMKFNMESAIKRYAEVAIALGAERGKDDYETAKNGVNKIFQLCEELDVEVKLSALNIPKDAIERMAEGAIKVERLLKNNPRNVTLEDAKRIYNEAY
ncbi:MAG: iron-containing alcohol dehydrogenase [Melioribacteraceae bacterium]|nr:iron-containing alcohol dehydrogenase [Melioribacteraceae bacterium]